MMDDSGTKDERRPARCRDQHHALKLTSGKKFLLVRGKLISKKKEKLPPRPERVV